MAIDLDAYRKQSRETWGQVARGWEDRRVWLMAITGPVNDWLADKADPQKNGDSAQDWAHEEKLEVLLRLETG